MNKIYNKWVSNNCKFAKSEYINIREDGEEGNHNPYRNYTQWSTGDEKIFFPASEVVRTLPPGMYNIRSSMSGIYFEKISTDLKGLIRFPNTTSDKILSEMEKFWNSEHLFRENKIAYKRGLLMYGPPGGGKSCTIKIVVADMIKRDGIVLNFDDSKMFMSGLRILREIHPKVPVVAIMEDLDSILSRDYNSAILNMLDGIEGVDKVVFLATTNYPEKLGSRIMNRPSRFDKKILIGLPSLEERKIFLSTKLNNNNEISKWSIDTDGMTLAHIKELVVAVKILGDDYKGAIETIKGMKKLIQSKDFDNYGDATCISNDKYAAYGTGKPYKIQKNSMLKTKSI